MENEKVSITITREFGSMGRAIGKVVANKLGFKYYDRDIIENAAPLAGENLEILGKFDGHDYSPFAKMAHPLGYGNRSLQKKLFDAESSIIMEYAHYNNCVIIGRCSDYILRNKKNNLSIFIYAPYNKRLDNCKKELRLSEEDAIRYISGVDKGREDFYKLITKSRFDDVENRHLLIDSSVLGIEGTADLIVSMVKKKYDFV